MFFQKTEWEIMMRAVANTPGLNVPILVLQADDTHNRFMKCLSDVNLLVEDDLNTSNLFEDIGHFIQSANADSVLKRILLNEKVCDGGDFFNQNLAITFIQKILKEEQSKKEDSCSSSTK